MAFEYVLILFDVRDSKVNMCGYQYLLLTSLLSAAAFVAVYNHRSLSATLGEKLAGPPNTTRIAV